MNRQQIKWLSSFDRETGSLSTYEARNCGYGDLLRAGLVTDRGAPSMPDLFITQVGRDFLDQQETKTCNNT